MPTKISHHLISNHRELIQTMTHSLRAQDRGWEDCKFNRPCTDGSAAIVPQPPFRPTFPSRPKKSSLQERSHLKTCRTMPCLFASWDTNGLAVPSTPCCIMFPPWMVILVGGGNLAADLLRPPAPSAANPAAKPRPRPGQPHGLTDPLYFPV